VCFFVFLFFIFFCIGSNKRRRIMGKMPMLHTVTG
jgi:hypothetical protein